MLFKKSEIDDVQKTLIRADLTIEARKYLSISLISGFLSSLFLTALFYV